MFEDSTFESMGVIRTRSRGWMLATFTLNGSVLLALVLLPLIYPQALPSLDMPLLMTTPAPPVAETKLRPVPVQTNAADTRSIENIQAPPRIPTYIARGDEPRDPGPINLGDTAQLGTGTSSADNPWSEHPPVVVEPQRPKSPVPVSLGVMSGLLYQTVRPVYPIIAQEAHVEGTVVLQATISKNGTIENLRVTSGPVLLQQAALDAVRQWRYRPYLLNGQPVDVETTVNVIFKMN